MKPREPEAASLENADFATLRQKTRTATAETDPRIPNLRRTATRLHGLFEPPASSRMGSGRAKQMLIILLVILLLLSLGSLPSWPYSRSWGYYPSGGLGLVVIILLVLLLLGRV